MDYMTKSDLRKTIDRFLNQRERASRELKVSRADIKADLAAVEVTAGNLRNKWKLIVNYSYWGHCRFIQENRRRFEAILPMMGAGHKEIRRHMEELMDYCAAQADLPKLTVDAQHI